MTIAPNKPKTKQPIVTLPKPETNQEFNWRNCWYPVTFLQDLAKNRPYSFSLYDEAFVLFRNQDGKLGCLTDLCPHRAAKLSDGQIIDGKIECLYHGWQFSTDGQCLHIPQLPADSKITAKACVPSFPVVERQGIVWMWAGSAETADDKLIPTVADLDDPTVASSDYMLDLPYDQIYFVENIVDPSHLYISHEATFKGRKYAQPLEMEVIDVSVQGIQGRYRKTRTPNQNWVNLNFIAPNLVTYKSVNPDRIEGSALYSLPLGQGRCRIMIRNYHNFSTWKLKLQPRWFEHWYRNQFLEEDLSLVVGQQEQVKRLGQSLKDLYLPLKTSDVLVVEYRKWLDKYGASLPYYQGYCTSKEPKEVLEDNQQTAPLDRLRRHTLICGSCNRAYRVTKRVKQVLVGLAIALAALAILTDDSGISLVAVALSLSATVLAVVAAKVRNHFEDSYCSSLR